MEKPTAPGYLERRKDDPDNRVSLVRLGKKDKSLEADFIDISRNLLSRIYQGFSDNEKKALIKLLTPVSNNF